MTIKTQNNMDNQKGPSMEHVSSHFFKTCIGCQYHSKSLVKSGNNPIYKHDCAHESAIPKPPFMAMSGNLRSYDNVVEPAGWCPFEVQE